MEFDKLLLDVLPVTFRWKKWVDILLQRYRQGIN